MAIVREPGGRRVSLLVAVKALPSFPESRGGGGRCPREISPLCNDGPVHAVLTGAWLVISIGGWIFISGWASGHAILVKRDPRAAIGWTGLIWLVPFVGALLYLLLGI